MSVTARRILHSPRRIIAGFHYTWPLRTFYTQTGSCLHDVGVRAHLTVGLEAIGGYSTAAMNGGKVLKEYTSFRL